MTRNICVLDQGPACEPEKLIVEVIGKHHPATQKIIVCDAVGKPLQAVTDAAAEETIIGEGVSSRLSIWDWSEKPGEMLQLEIATESGPPIHLPLSHDLRTTPRQDDAQLNQIVPVVPCTALPGINNARDLGTPVLVRSGYLYVFLLGKLWRELEVRFGDAGTRFHDVDVAEFRSSEGFAPGKRDATGVGLEDVWLPSQWNGHPAGPVQLIFSEVQLSAARLTFLESSDTRLTPRSRSPRLLVTERAWQRHWANSPDGLALLEAFASENPSAHGEAVTTRLRMELQAFPVSLCAPQRQRQPGQEWLLAQPARFVCDLSGSYPQRALTSTREVVETWRSGEDAPKPHDFEIEAWRTTFPAQGSTGALDDESMWHPQAARNDALANARSRQLYAVLVPDHMHRLRHLNAGIGTLQELIKECAKLALAHPHHASALLLQNLAVPSRIGDGRNPLHDSLQKKLDASGKREINKATAAVERANVWQLLESAQTILAECLQEDQYQQCLADHLSLEEFRYPAAMCFATGLVACLAVKAAQLDPLALKGDIHDAVTGRRLHHPRSNQGQRLVREIAGQPWHPLHKLFWPPVHEQALFETYECPAGVEPNQGDGQFRARALSRYEVMDEPDGELDTLDAITIAAALHAGALEDSFTAHPWFKAGMQVLAAIHRTLNGAVEAAKEQIAEAAENLANNQREQSHLQTEIDELQQRQAGYNATLDEYASTADLRLHGLSAEHLRQLMPSAFAESRFVRIGNVNIKDHYLFGLEDLPETTPAAAATRLYGRYLDAEGNDLDVTNAQTARRAGMPVVPASGVYFAIPRNGKTASILQELNRAIRNHMLANTDLIAARDSARQMTGALQAATDNLARATDGTLYRLLDSKTFSVSVLMMESWNVREAFKESEKVAMERGLGRQFLGTTIAPALDFLLAMEALISKVSLNQAALPFLNQAVLRLPDGIAHKLLGRNLAKHIVQTITVRIFAQATGATLWAGLSLADAYHASRWSDKAMWGHLLVATGSLLAAGGALLIGTSALLGPVGFVAVALIVGGSIAVVKLQNTPFEDWLAAGPFCFTSGTFNAIERTGINQTKGASPHLSDPSEAFYRLVGLLADIRISIDSNPDYCPSARPDSYDRKTSLERRANTIIRVETNVPGLAAQLGSLSANIHCRLIRTETAVRVGNWAAAPARFNRTLRDQSKPLLRHILPNAVELYMWTPANVPRRAHYQDYSAEHRWEVRAQLILEDKQRNRSWVFPAPEPRVVHIPPNYEQPNFKITGRPLWADQLTHAAAQDAVR